MPQETVPALTLSPRQAAPFRAEPSLAGPIASCLGPPRAPRALPLRLATPPPGAPEPPAEAPGATPEPEPRHCRGRTGLTRAGSASAQFPVCRAGGRCQLGIRGPVRKQHEGFRRRKRGSAPQPGTPPHCHVRRRIARGSRMSRPIRSRRAQAPEGSSHSRPAEGVGESHQSQGQGEKVLRQEPMRGRERVGARAPWPILGEGEGGARSDSESGAVASVDAQCESGGGGPRSPPANRRWARAGARSAA